MADAKDLERRHAYEYDFAPGDPRRHSPEFKAKVAELTARLKKTQDKHHDDN